MAGIKPRLFWCPEFNPIKTTSKGILKIQLNTREPGKSSKAPGPGSRKSFVASDATKAFRSDVIIYASVKSYWLTRRKGGQESCMEQY